MFRGAVIGVGNIALNGHLPAFLTDPELKKNVQIVAAVDLSPINLAKAKELFPLLHTYETVEQLFRSEKLDFVDICSPPHSHPEIIKKAVEHGFQLICEKPLALTFQEGKIVADLIKQAQLIFVPCHQYRYSPLWMTIRKFVDGEEIGKIVLAQFNVFRLKADSGNPQWKADWRVHPNISGGGVIVDTGSHYLYLLLSFFGKPKSITARTATLVHHDYPVEDTAIIIAEYERMVAQINLTWAAEHRANSTFFVGTKGSLFSGGESILLYKNGHQREFPGQDVSNKAAYVQWYAALFNEFVRRLQQKNHSYDMLNEALSVLKCAELCYESAKEGSTIYLQEKTREGSII